MNFCLATAIHQMAIIKVTTWIIQLWDSSDPQDVMAVNNLLGSMPQRQVIPGMARKSTI